MSTSYDALPTPLPSGSHIPRRPSVSYPHSYDRPPPHPPMTPPESRRMSYTYDSYRSSNYWHSDPYHDYNRSSSPGVHDRYRDAPGDWSQASSSSRYPPRDFHDSRYGSSPNSARDKENSRGRRDSTSSRVFEPSDSWIQSNGSGRERKNSVDRHNLSSPERPPPPESHGRNHDRDGYTGKALWASGSALQERNARRNSFTSDAHDRYDQYRPSYDDSGRSRFNSTYDGYGPRNSRRSLSRSRSFSRSPARRYSPRPRSRSRSRSRSPSRSRPISRSRSGSWSRSRSRTPPRRFRLPTRDLDSDMSGRGRPTGSSWSKDRSYHDRYQENSARVLDKKLVYGQQSYSQQRQNFPRPTTDHISSSFDTAKSLSRSPSHSSIASSRETSVKPFAPRPTSMIGDAAENQNSTGNQLSDGSSQIQNATVASSPNADALRKDPDPTGSEPFPGSDPASNDQSVEHQPSAGSINPDEFTKSTSDGSFLKDLSDTVAADKEKSLPPDVLAMQEAISKESTTLAQANTFMSSQDQQATEETSESLAPEAAPDDITTIIPRDPIAAPPQPVTPSDFVKRPIPDFRPEDIPEVKEAKTFREALRSVVMTRLLADRQTSEQRADPILLSNLALPKSPFEAPIPGASIQALMDEMTHPQSARVNSREETHDRIRPGLVERFAERQRSLKDKVQRLTEEYVRLHDKWLTHCAMLDKQAKAKSTALTTDDRSSAMSISAPPVTGRTTRRSAATLGDAVRSDLEMEQIIASLGYNEATDPNQLCLRNVATIPDMISVTKGRVDYAYDDDNLRVDNPAEYYAPQTGIHDWTEDEKQILMEKYALYPKQFGTIARHLPNKTAAQCVDFYYLHKKVDIDFRHILAMHAPGRRGKGKRKHAKRKANALLADIRKHDAEVSETGAGASRGKGRAKKGSVAAAVSVTASPTPAPAPVPVPVPAVEVKKPSSRRSAVHLESTPTTDTPTPEPEAKSRRRRASNRTSLGAARNDGEEDATEEPEARPAKRARRGGRKVLKSAAIVSDDATEEFTPPVVPENKSSEQDPNARRKLWSDEDRDLFLKLLGQHGDDFKRIAASMPNKTMGQVSTFYKTNLISLGLHEIVENAPKRSVSPAQPPDTPRQSRGSPDDSLTAFGQNSDDIPPMASLPLDEAAKSDAGSSTKPGTPTPPAAGNSAVSNREFVQTFSSMVTHPGEMATLYPQPTGYTDQSRFPRYTTGVAAYGAPPMPMSSLYTTQGYAAPGFAPPPTGYPPPPGSAPGTTGLTPYAPSGGYASARHYLPYAYPYQTSYPIISGQPPPSATPSTGGTSSPAPGVSPFTHALGDPRPFYHYSS